MHRSRLVRRKGAANALEPNWHRSGDRAIGTVSSIGTTVSFYFSDARRHITVFYSIGLHWFTPYQGANPAHVVTDTYRTVWLAPSPTSRRQQSLWGRLVEVCSFPRHLSCPTRARRYRCPFSRLCTVLKTVQDHSYLRTKVVGDPSPRADANENHE
jgi:hypothetical protein